MDTSAMFNLFTYGLFIAAVELEAERMPVSSTLLFRQPRTLLYDEIPKSNLTN